MATPRERAILAAPIPSGRAGLLTPFQFVFTGEDRLRLNVLNTIAGVGVRTSWRMLVASQAAAVANVDDFTPLRTDGLEETHFIEMGQGALSNVVVRATRFRTEPGQLFVRLDVVRGTGAAALVLGTLIAGYIGSWGGRAWPGSPLELPTDGSGHVRAFAGSVPAAGAPPLTNLPLTQQRARLLSAQALLTTSGVAGARTPVLRLMHDGVFVFDGQSSANQGPGVTMQHNWGAGLAAPAGSGTFMGQGPIPAGAALSNHGADTATLRVVTNGIDAADQWTALTVVAELWLNPVTTSDG